MRVVAADPTTTRTLVALDAALEMEIGVALSVAPSFVSRVLLGLISPMPPVSSCETRVTKATWPRLAKRSSFWHGRRSHFRAT